MSSRAMVEVEVSLFHSRQHDVVGIVYLSQGRDARNKGVSYWQFSYRRLLAAWALFCPIIN